MLARRATECPGRILCEVNLEIRPAVHVSERRCSSVQDKCQVQVSAALSGNAVDGFARDSFDDREKYRIDR